jgi:signal transduction histidine kinase
VAVTDDGPGLPAHESRVLTNGEETPLEHGSGMGLWVVHWIVSRYGGELDFEVDDGTTVRLSLPAADPVPSDDVPGV